MNGHRPQSSLVISIEQGLKTEIRSGMVVLKSSLAIPKSKFIID